MRKFIYTSDALGGEVTFEFENDLLLRFDMSKAQFSEAQHINFLRYLPRELAEVTKFLEASTGGKFTEILEDVTFDKFWDRYNEKIRSSKKKTLQKWNRLSQLNRNKAYYFISKYEMSIPNGVPKKYAETYLNSELWNN